MALRASSPNAPQQVAGERAGGEGLKVAALHGKVRQPKL